MLSNPTNQPKSTVELGFMCPRGLTGPPYQSRYCASNDAFLFSFVYVMYLDIAPYLYRKQIKSKMGNKLYLRMLFICLRLIRLDRQYCHTMTVKELDKCSLLEIRY